MKCNEVRLTEVCKRCGIKSGSDVDCPTVHDGDSSVTYAIPPSSVFNLVGHENHVGAKVVCINADRDFPPGLEVGAVYTVLDQFNESFQYITLEEFKRYPNIWFVRENFKKLKANYDGVEYTLSAKIGETK